MAAAKPSGVFRTGWPTNEQIQSCGVAQLGVSIETEVSATFGPARVLYGMGYHTVPSYVDKAVATNATYRKLEMANKRC